MSVVNLWNTLPSEQDILLRDDVESSSLKSFESSKDKALNFEVSPAFSRGFEYNAEVSSNIISKII